MTEQLARTTLAIIQKVENTRKALLNLTKEISKQNNESVTEALIPKYSKIL